MTQPNHEPRYDDERKELTEHELMEILRQPGACAPIVGGDISGESGTEQSISLMGHAIHITDLIDPNIIGQNRNNFAQAGVGSLTVSIEKDWKYAFDHGFEDFRMSKKGLCRITDEMGEEQGGRIVCRTLQTEDHRIVDLHFLTLG